MTTPLQELLGAPWLRATLEDATLRATKDWENATGRRPTLQDVELIETVNWLRYTGERSRVQTASKDVEAVSSEQLEHVKRAYDQWAYSAAIVAQAERWHGKLEDELSGKES